MAISLGSDEATLQVIRALEADAVGSLGDSLFAPALTAQPHVVALPRGTAWPPSGSDGRYLLGPTPPYFFVKHLFGIPDAESLLWRATGQAVRLFASESLPAVGDELWTVLAGGLGVALLYADACPLSALPVLGGLRGVVQGPSWILRTRFL